MSVLSISICSVFLQTPSPTPPPEKKTPLSGVASALKGVEFIAQHIRKADKDTEVSGKGEMKFSGGNKEGGCP